MSVKARWRVVFWVVVLLALVIAGGVVYWMVEHDNYETLFFQMSGPSKKVQGDLYRARTLAESGKLEEAFGMAESLLKKNDKLAVAYMVKGVVYLQRGEFFKGDENLRRAISLGLEPKDLALVYYNLGISAKQQYRPEMAIAYLQKCLQVNPYMPAAREALKNLQNESSYLES